MLRGSKWGSKLRKNNNIEKTYKTQTGLTPCDDLLGSRAGLIAGAHSRKKKKACHPARQVHFKLHTQRRRSGGSVCVLELTGLDVAECKESDANVSVDRPLLRLAVRAAAVVDEPSRVPLGAGVYHSILYSRGQQWRGEKENYDSSGKLVEVL